MAAASSATAISRLNIAAVVGPDNSYLERGGYVERGSDLQRGGAARRRVRQLVQCANAERFSFATDGSGASSDSRKWVTARMSVSR